MYLINQPLSVSIYASPHLSPPCEMAYFGRTPSTSEILLGGVLDHLRDGGVAAIRVGAGTAQIRRVFGEILNINSHGGSGELPISAVALLAVVERGLYCSQSAQNLARRAAAP